MARSRRGGGLLSALAREVQRDLTSFVAKGTRNAAVKILNGLVDAGPGWSGEFSRSWYVVPPGEAPKNGPRSGEGIYYYTYRNVSLKKIENAINLGGRSTKFEIVNTAPHANIAIDKEDSVFYAIGLPYYPQKFGSARPTDGDGQDLHMRYQIGTKGYDPERPESSITAPKDWFPTYVASALQSDLSKGFSFPQ
jgi:hypothetical protein